MADHSKIEWTESTWNPVRGCSIVSPGCTNCYAMRQAHRHAGKGGAYEGLTQMTKGGPVWTGEVRLVPELLDWPLRKRKPLRIFVNSMSDLFHEDVPDEFIAAVFGVMARADWHTFQVLTKRPERALRFFQWLGAMIGPQGAPSFACDPLMGCLMQAGRRVKLPPVTVSTAHPGPSWPLPNVWLGVSVEDQRRADERIPLLLQTPAAVRWISAEPLLGPVDLEKLCKANPAVGRNSLCGGVKVDWVVAGGESGPDARPMHPDWVRSLRDQCKAWGVPFFFKQWGAWSPEWAWARAENVDSTNGAATNPNERMGPRGLAVQGPDTMFRVGKKKAGRLLDGRAFDEYPA